MLLIRRRSLLSAVTFWLIFCLILATVPAPLAAQDTAPPFRIMVLEGDGAINNIHEVINRAVSVQVADQNQTPLSGVSVTFFLPNDGPSGLFPNGSRVLTVFTDDKGVATSRSIHFNNQVGIMPIKVVASLFSQAVTTQVMQTNVSSAASVKSSFVPAAGGSQGATRGKSHKKLILLLLVAGAAAGAGIYFATRSSSPSATISVGNPGAGVPVVGPPQ